MNKILNYLKRFWNYIWHDDSFGSYIANFVVAFVFIKFIFFPAIGFALNNDFPVVAIVSGSMEHKIVNSQLCTGVFIGSANKRVDFNEYWRNCGNDYQKNFNLTSKEFQKFDYKDGLDIGDVMILYGKKPSDIQVGEVLVFIPQDKMTNGKSRFFVTKGPVIHRVVKKWVDENGKYHFQTKGDHNRFSGNNFETDIPQEDVIAVAVVRIPYIGYAKIVLNNIITKVLGN